MEATVVLLALVIIPAIWMLMLLSVMWHRLERYIRQQQPAVALLIIHTYGSDERAISQALAHHTRLDLSEIDELLDERRTGPLPLRLPWRRASLLADELRALGSDVEVER